MKPGSKSARDPEPIDVTANRKLFKWSHCELTGQVLWTYSLFALNLRPFWSWRRTQLRLFAAQDGQGGHVFPSLRVVIPWKLTLEDDCAVGNRVILYALGPITIGARATASQSNHPCAETHDLSRPDRSWMKLLITVADVFDGPGVTIGRGAIAAAEAVELKDIEAGSIVACNPSRAI